MNKTQEYVSVREDGSKVVIGQSDINPGMLKRLKQHDTQHKLDPVLVREAAGEKTLYIIPAHTGAYEECCPHCCQHTPRHKADQTKDEEGA